MTVEKFKEIIHIAEELAQEIYIGKLSTSPLAKRWKEKSPERYEDIRKQKNLSEEIAFHNSINTDEALEEVNRRISSLPQVKKLSRRPYNIGIAVSFLLIFGVTTTWLWIENREKEIGKWVTAIPVVSKTSLSTQNNEPMELTANNLVIKGEQLNDNTMDGKKDVSIRLNTESKFNKLSMPEGGEYRLTLENGTVVQVNIASKLKFPTYFKKHIH